MCQQQEQNLCASWWMSIKPHLADQVRTISNDVHHSIGFVLTGRRGESTCQVEVRELVLHDVV